MAERKSRDQAKELAESQAKFVETIKLMIEGMEILGARVGNWDKYMRTVNETMHEYSDLAKELLDTHRAMLKAFGEMQVAINQNTDRLDTVIVKLESYFGSGDNLEYDN
jgi:hypothetical protein